MGFNIDMEFVQNLVIKKARNAGDFTIKYIHAALNKESYSAEVFIEFEESIRVHNLIAQLETNGACQVNVVTFKHNDANESASSALLRVWMSAEKSGYEHMKGSANKELWDKTQMKYDAEMQKQEDNEKNQAKLDAGIKQSLEEVGDKVGQIEDKVDHMDGKIDNVQQGVCVIIPDYQKTLKELKEQLAHKTKEVDRIEYRMGQKTHEINKQDDIISDMSYDIENYKAQVKQLEKDLATTASENQHLKQIIELSKASEAAKWIIETERAMKRARGD